MVGRYCCIPLCKSASLKNRTVTFSPFPRDLTLRKEWIQVIERNVSDSLNLSEKCPWSIPTRRVFGLKHQVLCGYHFDKSGRKGYHNKITKYFDVLFDTITPIAYHEIEISNQTGAKSLPQINLNNQTEFNANSPFESRANVQHDYFLVDDSSSLAEMIKKLQGENFKLQCKVDEQAQTLFEVTSSLAALKIENSKLNEYVLKSNMTEFEKLKTGLKEEILSLQEKFSSATKENVELKNRITNFEKQLKETQRFSLKSVSHSPDMLNFYTGCNSFEVFEDIFSIIEPDLNEISLYGSGQKRKNKRECHKMRGRPMALSFQNQLFLVLCRLRAGLLEQDLAYRFKVSVSTVSHICLTWFDLLEKRLTNYKIWPSRALIDKYMPEEFKDKFPNTRVIIDATELYIEKPSDYKSQSDTWSSYKTHNTAKALIGITPNGFVSFVSDLAPGRISDVELTQDSGILKLLEAGDSVMADRGFLIKEMLAEKGVTLNIPPFLHGKPQLNEKEEIYTRAIASVRIHVERVISGIKDYHILSSIFPNSMHNQLNKVWKICVYLLNFCNEPLLDRKSQIINETMEHL